MVVAGEPSGARIELKLRSLRGLTGLTRTGMESAVLRIEEVSRQVLSPAAPPRLCGAAQANRTRGREAVLGRVRDASEVEKGRGADDRDNPQDPREDRGSARGKVEMTKSEPLPRSRQERSGAARWRMAGTERQTAKNAQFAKTDRLPADAAGRGSRFPTTMLTARESEVA